METIVIYLYIDVSEIQFSQEVYIRHKYEWFPYWHLRGFQWVLFLNNMETIGYEASYVC